MHHILIYLMYLGISNYMHTIAIHGSLLGCLFWRILICGFTFDVVVSYLSTDIAEENAWWKLAAICCEFVCGVQLHMVRLNSQISCMVSLTSLPLPLPCLLCHSALLALPYIASIASNAICGHFHGCYIPVLKLIIYPGLQ